VARLITGPLPREHGVTVRLMDGAAADRDGGTYLSSSIPTVATLAQRAGITTYASVANALVGPDTGLTAGFGRFELPPPTSERRFPSGREINARFLAWAERHRDVRFFAYLHYMEMHSPYVPSTRPATTTASEHVRNGDATALSNVVRDGGPPPSPEDLAHLKALYTHSLRDWDDMLAQLLRGLDGLGLREETIVIVTADHGEEFLEHGQLGHAKQLYEESLRVPLVIAGPGIPVGARRDPAELVDLLPTITAALGAERPAALPGRDLLAVPTVPSRPAFAEVRGGIGFSDRGVTLAVVRDPPWKLLWAPESGQSALFNLHEDPAEVAPAVTDPAVIDRLLDAGRRYWSSVGDVEPRETTPDVTDELRSLGYIE
jgi:arylsulfatase A-like enzyme